MANEITANVSVSFDKSPTIKIDVQPDEFQITVAGADYTWKTQLVGTSAEALDLGEIGTPGLVVIRNTDTSNFVLFGHDDSGFKDDVKLLASGKWNLFYCSQAVPQVKADTASCLIEYCVIEA